MTQTPLRQERQESTASENAEVAKTPRRKWLLIAGGVLAAAAAGAGAIALTGGGEKAVEKPPIAATGTEGSLAVSATGVECGVATVGPEELPQRATGQFCLVNVSVKNTGKEALLLDPGAQRAVDGEGREHAVADQAGVFLNDQQPSLLDEIAPGAEVRGVLAFDVPAGTRLTALVLHESMGSTGVRVPLS